VPPPAGVVADKIPWVQGQLENGLAQAQTRKAVLMAYFYAAKDEPSVAMSRTTFSDDRVVAALANVVCAKVDYASLSPAASRIPIRNLPVIVWFNADGTPRDRTDGVVEPERFLAETARILADIGTINDLRRKLPERKDDIDARFDLYRRLRGTGDEDGMNEQKSAILRLDPEGKSRARIRFRYEDLTSAIEKHWTEKHELPMAKVEELRLFVEMQDDPEITWDGWMRLANTAEYLERMAAGNLAETSKHRATRRDCLARAWRSIPQDRDYVHGWSFTYAELFWSQRAELTEDDKNFFANLTLRMIQLFDQEGPAFGYRARALMLKGQREDAQAAAAKAVELAPSDPLMKELLQQIGAADA
jgi:hypothetical protein